MKKIFFLMTLIIIFSNCFAEDWGNWIDVGHQIEVSFKISNRGCQGYTYARIRNVSSTSIFCNVTITFTKICNNQQDGEANVAAYKIKPGEISQSAGSWYNAERITNIRLTVLTDKDCKNIIGNVSTNGGVSEIVFQKKNEQEEIDKKNENIRLEQEKQRKELEIQREKDLDEKYEKQKKKIDEQAKRDLEKNEEVEAAATHKTQSIVTSNMSSYPATDEGRLQAKFDADAKRKAENIQALGVAIPSLVENTYGIIQGIRNAKEERQKKAEAFYAEKSERLARVMEREQHSEDINEQWKLRRQKEFITPRSNEQYFLYKAYVDYYFSNNHADRNRSEIKKIINLYFYDINNNKIEPRDFTKLLNMFTWRDGDLLTYFMSNDFIEYITGIKGVTFARQTEARLQKIKSDIVQIMMKRFGSFFLTGQLLNGLTYSPLYKDFNYNEKFFVTLNKSDTGSVPQLIADQQISAINFEASKDTRKQHGLPFLNGKIAVYIKKIHSCHLINLNSSFIFSLDKDLENNIQLAQLASDRATDGKNQDIDPRDRYFMLKDSSTIKAFNLIDYTTTLLKYNADMSYVSSFGINETINVNIYFMISHNFFRENSNDPNGKSVDLYFGYISDNNPENNNSNRQVLQSILNTPFTDEENYFFEGDILREFINRNFITGNRIVNLDGLSLLLVPDLKIDWRSYYGINLEKIFKYYPLDRYHLNQ